MSLDDFLVALTTAVVRVARQVGYEETADDVLDAWNEYQEAQPRAQWLPGGQEQ